MYLWIVYTGGAFAFIAAMELGLMMQLMHLQPL